MLIGESELATTSRLGPFERVKSFLQERNIEWRLVLVLVFTGVWFGGVVYKAFSIQVVQHEKYARKVDRIVHTTFGRRYWVRGVISDRSGTPLVVSSELPSITADPLGFVGGAVYPTLSAPCFMSPGEFARWRKRSGRKVEQMTVCDRFFYRARQLVRKARTDPKAGEELTQAVLPRVERISRALSLDPYRLMERIVGAALKERRFIYLKRQVPEDVVARLTDDPEVRALSVRAVSESARFYPMRALAPQVLGFTDVDGRGIEGIERRFDELLRGKTMKMRVMRDSYSHLLFPDGVPTISFEGVGNVVLTIDSLLQAKVERTLQEYVDEYRANYGIAVVMDARTGEILAMANTPVFDPARRGEVPPSARRNKAVVDAYELGSVMKPLAMLKTLDLGLVRAGERVRLDFKYVDPKTGKEWKIKDHKYQNASDILVDNIIVDSSNKGAAKLAKLLGKRTLYGWLRTLGFGSRTGVEFPGEARGILRPLAEWYTDQILATHAFGHGFTASLVQLLQAYTVFANEGRIVRPHLVRYVVDSRGSMVECVSPASCGRKVPSRRVVRHPSVVRDVISMMEGVVIRGTARRASLARFGYTVAGKTGTAEKLSHKKASERKEGESAYSVGRNRTTFIGLVPSRHARILVAVLLDEPKHKVKTKDGREKWVALEAGSSSAVVFRDIALETVKYLGIPPDHAPTVKTVRARVRRPKAPEPYIPPLPVPGRATMPDLRGLPLGAALDRLADLDAECEVRGHGVVMRQIPEPGGPLRGCVLELAPAEELDTHDATRTDIEGVPGRTRDW